MAIHLLVDRVRVPNRDLEPVQLEVETFRHNAVATGGFSAWFSQPSSLT